MQNVREEVSVVFLKVLAQLLHSVIALGTAFGLYALAQSKPQGVVITVSLTAIVIAFLILMLIVYNRLLNEKAKELIDCEERLGRLTKSYKNVLNGGQTEE